MKILIPTVQVPFIRGGAEMMTNGLLNAFLAHGHEVETLSVPFKFFPERELIDIVHFCNALDCTNFNGHHIDLMVALQFPAIYMNHPNKVLWMMHQHRVVYDLKHTLKEFSPDYLALEALVNKLDNEKLAQYESRYSMSQNITKRLSTYNGITSTPLYHPPPNENHFFCEAFENYIFCPSRIETLKRQDLLIKALSHSTSDIGVIIAGEGGQKQNFEKLVEELGLSHRVRFVGQISDREKEIYYANCLAVFFAPYDEDYGYITLEAMLSSKAVITCSDSGGPMEFVIDGETGLSLEPDEHLIACAIDKLAQNRQLAEQLGRNGRERYVSLNITWNNVVERLLESV